MRPHRWQPTRLPCPWDSPGKNTGVGCHFLLQCMKVKSEREVTQSCLTLSDPMDCSLPGSSIHRIFQARVLEWVAIAFSKQSLFPAISGKKKMKDSIMSMLNPYSGQGKREDQTLWTFDWCQDWGASINIIQWEIRLESAY